MCGIVGGVFHHSCDELELRTLSRSMSSPLAHRGPDASGEWVDPARGVFLGHRRLSIIDLSPTGAQPMISQSGRYVLTYNGEIYNFPDLRRELAGQGASFRGTSDTEVLLTLVEQLGLQRTLLRLNGMFAIGLWDAQEGKLFLARDRAGEKPLYYTLTPEAFGFASELKALALLPGFYRGLNMEAVAAYLTYCYVPSPACIYEGVAKLPPGCFLEYDSGRRQSRVERYWDPALVRAQRGVHRGDEVEILGELERLLREAVHMRTVADVPLGAFLSGGLDSSLVVALMQAQSSRPVRTFTIGCDSWGFNEAEDARCIAQHLGTEHHEHYVTAADALAVIPQLPQLYDEPFSDSSQIPTFLVAQMARKEVTVCLSGDAGDEIFGGYNRHLYAETLWRRLGRFPLGLRRMLSSACRFFSPAGWERVAQFLPPLRRLGNVGHKVHKLANILESSSPQDMYRRLISCWPSPPLRGDSSFPMRFEPIKENLTEWMMHRDFDSYLPDDILVKLDRATMGVSLEGRIPYLDHRLVEFAWSLPTHYKIRGGVSKWALRQILYRYVPRSLLDRPKMGFGVPMDAWLRGPLREWAQELVGDVDRGHFLCRDTVQRTWSGFLAGQGDSQYQIWNLLMLLAWSRQAPHKAN